MKLNSVVFCIMSLSILCSCTDSGSESGKETKVKSRKKTAGHSGTEYGTNSPRKGATTSNTGRGHDDIPFGLPEKSKKRVKTRYLSHADPARATLAQFMDAGRRALNDKDYESAIMIADQAIAVHPNSALGYCLRGRAGSLLIYGGREDQALKDLDKAIEMGMGTGLGSGRAYEAKARIYSFRKQSQLALENINKAIEIEPTEHDYYKLRAAIHRELHEPDKALADYDLCIAVNPRNATSHFLRAKFLEGKGSYDKALEDYAFVIEAEKKANKSERTVVSRKFRSEIFSKLGKQKEAANELTEALKIEHNDDELLLMRGRAYEKLKKFKEAEQDFSTAISNAPEFAAGAHEARAALYERMGKTEPAEADRARAKELRSAPAERPLF